MSAQIIQLKPCPMSVSIAVSFRLLLGLYSIIPLCLALQMAMVGFGMVLRESLPSRPTQFFIVSNPVRDATI